MNNVTLRSTTPEVIAMAEAWLSSNVNLSDNSRNVRRAQLNHLFDYFRKNVITIGSDEMNGFLRHLRHEKKYRSETISSSITTARSFLTYLEDRGFRKPVIWKLQRLPRDKTRATAFELEHYQTLLARAANLTFGYSYWPTAIVVGWSTGLRISDVKNLQWVSVDLTSDLLRVNPIKLANVRQELQIPLEPELRQRFQSLLANLEEPPSPDDYVLPSMAFNSDANLTKEFRALCDECNLKGYSFKSFRHALVTRLLNAGVDTRIIGSITGQSVATVQRYVRTVTTEAKVEALARAREGLSKSRIKTLDITLPTFAPLAGGMQPAV